MHLGRSIPLARLRSRIIPAHQQRSSTSAALRDLFRARGRWRSFAEISSRSPRASSAASWVPRDRSRFRRRPDLQPLNAASSTLHLLSTANAMADAGVIPPAEMHDLTCKVASDKNAIVARQLACRRHCSLTSLSHLPARGAALPIFAAKTGHMRADDWVVEHESGVGISFPLEGGPNGEAVRVFAASSQLKGLRPDFVDAVHRSRLFDGLRRFAGMGFSDRSDRRKMSAGEKGSVVDGRSLHRFHGPEASSARGQSCACRARRERSVRRRPRSGT